MEKDYLSTVAYLFLARLNDLEVLTRETRVGVSGGQYVGRTETKRKAYRLTLRYVEGAQQNPYGSRYRRPDSTSQMSLETSFKNMFVSSRTKSLTATFPFAGSWLAMAIAISYLAKLRIQRMPTSSEDTLSARSHLQFQRLLRIFHLSNCSPSGQGTHQMIFLCPLIVQ